MPIISSWKTKEISGQEEKARKISRTWLRARSRSSPLPALAGAVLEGSTLNIVAHVLHCSTTLSADEYIHASTKRGFRTLWGGHCRFFRNEEDKPTSVSRKRFPKAPRKKPTLLVISFILPIFASNWHCLASKYTRKSKTEIVLARMSFRYGFLMMDSNGRRSSLGSGCMKGPNHDILLSFDTW